MSWLPPSQVYGPPIPANTPMNPDGTYGDVPTAADFAAGFVASPSNEKIVEQTFNMRCGASDALRVFGHEDIDGQVVAQASCDEPGGGVGTVAVAGEHVTRIEPDEPYDAVTYGTVVSEEVLLDGTDVVTVYTAAWGNMRGVHTCQIGEFFGCRLVTKRPSWVPKPSEDRNAQPQTRTVPWPR